MKPDIPAQILYVLAEEDYGGTFSSPYLPIGIAIESEEQAKQWVVERADQTYKRTYWRVRVKKSLSQ